MVESELRLFDGRSEPAGRPPKPAALEPKFNAAANATKSALLIAQKVHADLSTCFEDVKGGRVSGITNLVGNALQGVEELSNCLPGLMEDLAPLRAYGASQVAAYLAEITAALAERGIVATKGLEPYWLVYPAWFTIKANAKGFIEVTVNGDVLDTVRPSLVAEIIEHKTKEDAQPKQFIAMIKRVREILRRAGAPAGTLRLDDVFDLLLAQPVRRGAKRSDYSRADFYYSVHRVSEQETEAAAAGLTFPPASRSDYVFFTRDNEPRRYLTVAFHEVGKK